MKRSLFLLAFALISACAGEVHLTNDHAVAPPIAPPATPPALYEENFIYKKTSGTQAVAFLISPHRMLMKPVKEKMAVAIGEFTRSLFALSDSSLDFKFFVEREVEPGPVDVLSLLDTTPDRTLWNPSTIQFFTESFARLPDFVGANEFAVPCPFISLANLAQKISVATISSPGPVWTHVIYLRDTDFDYNSADPIQAKYVASLIKYFKSQLDTHPLSSSRSMIQLVSYLDSHSTSNASPTASPYREVSENLQGLINPFNHRWVELDPLMSAQVPAFSPALTGAPNVVKLPSLDQQLSPFMVSLSQNIFDFSSHIILQRTPKRETLEVLVKKTNTSIPREDTSFNVNTNELSILSENKYQLHSGDEIKVRYYEESNQK